MHSVETFGNVGFEGLYILEAVLFSELFLIEPYYLYLLITGIVASYSV